MYTPTKNESHPKSKEQDFQISGQNLMNTIDDTVIEVKEDLNDAANSANKAVGGVCKLVNNAVDAANDELEYVKDAVATKIRSNPVQSSVIALGVGFIIGTLVSR